MLSTKLFVRSCLLLGICFLSACSWFGIVPGGDYIVGDDGVFRDRQGDYLEAETLPRTKIPAGLDGYIIDDLLVIPELNGSVQTAFLEAPRPAATVGRNDRGVVIQRMQDKSWIVIDSSPSQVWSRIRDFWISNGINIEDEEPTEGRLETGWFVLQNNVLTREKFKVTVDTGFQDDSSEIRLLHVSMPQSTPILGKTVWPSISSDTEFETKMLNNLSVYLVDSSGLVSAGSVSFLAGTISSKGKTSIIKTSDGKDLLRLNAQFNRSWAAVARALQRAEIPVLSQSQEEGTFDVSYAVNNNDEEPGFFKKLFTLNGLLSGKDPRAKAYSLRIQLLEAGSNVDITIEKIETDMENEGSTAETEASLLTTIREFLA